MYRALICATAQPSSFVDTMLPAHDAVDAYRTRAATHKMMSRSILLLCVLVDVLNGRWERGSLYTAEYLYLSAFDDNATHVVQGIYRSRTSQLEGQAHGEKQPT